MLARAELAGKSFTDTAGYDSRLAQQSVLLALLILRQPQQYKLLLHTTSVGSLDASHCRLTEHIRAAHGSSEPASRDPLQATTRPAHLTRSPSSHSAVAAVLIRPPATSAQRLFGSGQSLDFLSWRLLLPLPRFCPRCVWLPARRCCQSASPWFLARCPVTHSTAPP